MKRSDRELLRLALHGAANWMETGNFLLSAQDIKDGAGNKKCLKLLGRTGYEEVERLREMASEEGLSGLLKR